MKTSIATAPATARAHADRGAHAREQLLLHATRIFAEKGYAAAATREICQAAGVNVAAIHYYFGDKEALYREVLTAPLTAVAERFARCEEPGLTFAQAIRHVLEPFVRMALDERARPIQRLHLREALEPSTVCRELVDRVVVPLHNALVRLLARECRLAQPDDALHQLAFAIVALANDYAMSRDFVRMIAPSLLDGDDAVERIVERLTGYAEAMLAHEIARRGSVQ
jgi:AcrR family transcriptional regulator